MNYDNENLNSKEKILMYHCKSCCNSLFSFSDNSITTCIFCGSKEVKKNVFDNNFSFKNIIPFSVNKAQAISLVSKHINFLVHKKFKNISSIKGIFVPCYLSEYDVSGIIEFEGKKISKWKSENYKYIKTDTYLITRGGNASFENTLINVSKCISNDVFNYIKPFNYTLIKKFSLSDVTDYFIENINENDAKEKANQNAKYYFTTTVKNNIDEYTDLKEKEININLDIKKGILVFVPVWFINIKYNNKYHTIAVNGQTGKVFLDIPKNKKKIILLWFSLFVLIFLFMLFIFKVIL